MVVIDAITEKFVQTIGGEETIYAILSMVFVFTVLYVFYKITTY